MVLPRRPKTKMPGAADGGWCLDDGTDDLPTASASGYFVPPRVSRRLVLCAKDSSCARDYNFTGSIHGGETLVKRDERRALCGVRFNTCRIDMQVSTREPRECPHCPCCPHSGLGPRVLDAVRGTRKTW